MASAFYDGNAIFGNSNRVTMVENPTAAQLAAFFGVSGTVSLYGGTRGRVFEVEGVLVQPTLSALAGAEALIRSYADGLGRVLTDTMGISWPNVVLRRYQRIGGWRWGAGGLYCQHYKAFFEGMT